MSHDAIVIGAGPAGTATALALAQQGWSVAIVERSDFPRRKVCGEFISAASMTILDSLGVGAAVRSRAGPEVRRLALFASGPSIEAPMPRARGEAFGRAIGRDVLDTLLLDAARSAGVTVFQPWRAADVSAGAETSFVQIETRDRQQVLTAPVVVAAHGSWEHGNLPTHLQKQHGPRDFLGFKAHLKNASLAADLMPLLAFPGGYGGMVWSDNGRLSLSFCIRRDVLATLRKRQPGRPAAEAVHAHIVASCPAAKAAIGGAWLEEDWLAAGPIRPGLRACYVDDIFRVGNVAGESHPIIAEGISMALQSGWMLARELGRAQHFERSGRACVGQRYAAAWRKQFSTRVRLAALLAHLAISPTTARAIQTIVRLFPASLSVGAILSGKTRPGIYG
jgi:menaquinone-9 beta-reductase